ncbi:MAG: cysteine-rich CWC family protein [Verrucomicrobia bacterium]|nr:cysteine-rich CWC family protein [Verrucomicrobiota bacterium]MCH8527614.1 cysteine-rich CWC family protein [Kiritimatiellia bacterium]
MNVADPDPSTCPLCGRPNHCGACSNAASCWCAEIVIPAELIARVPAASRNKACICGLCVEEFHREDRKKRIPAQLAREGEYYFEKGRMVFTRDYLLRRGYCCGNGCRHCPYGCAP